MTSPSDLAAELIQVNGRGHHPSDVCQQALGYLGAVGSERLSPYQRQTLERARDRLRLVIAWLQAVEVRERRESWPVGTKTWTGD
jgi:hypothetical protein